MPVRIGQEKVNGNHQDTSSYRPQRDCQLGKPLTARRGIYPFPPGAHAGGWATTTMAGFTFVGQTTWQAPQPGHKSASMSIMTR